MEGFCFQGAGLDRAAELRPRAGEILETDDARILPLWRMKPLVTGDPADRLAWVAPGDPALAQITRNPVFLGRSDDGPRFALDISEWTPDDPLPDSMDSFSDRSEQVHPDMPEGSRFAELRAVMTRLNPLDAEIAATARSLLSWHGSHRFCARCGAESRIAQGGWQRDCPDCGASHYPRTDPVVIMLVTSGNRVLIGRSPGWPDGMYSLLAGFVEPGETPEAAVRREVFEEAGVVVGKVRYLASQPWPYPSSLMMGYAAEALSEEITLDPAELDDARWISREEMAAVFRGEHPTLWAARRGAIARSVLAHWLSDSLESLSETAGATG